MRDSTVVSTLIAYGNFDFMTYGLSKTETMTYPVVVFP